MLFSPDHYKFPWLSLTFSDLSEKDPFLPDFPRPYKPWVILSTTILKLSELWNSYDLYHLFYLWIKYWSYNFGSYNHKKYALRLPVVFSANLRYAYYVNFQKTRSKQQKILTEKDLKKSAILVLVFKIFNGGHSFHIRGLEILFFSETFQKVTY